MKPDDDPIGEGSSHTGKVDARFDGLYRLAKRLCGVTIARIALDTSSGSTEPGSGLPASPRPPLQSVLARLQQDAADAPVRFFAGYPMYAGDGSVLALFYVADPQPRILDDEQHQSLRDIADSAASMLEHALQEEAARRATEALLAQENRMSLAIQGSGTGIWDRNVVTGEIHYSPSWKALLGYTADEVGERIEESYNRVHPDDLAYTQQAMQAHFSGQTENYEVEHRLRCRDGSYKWVCSRGKVVARDEQGRALRMLGTTTDITALRTLSEHLQRSVELITRLTDQVPGMVFQFHRYADGSARFTYASAGSRDLFELEPEQLLADPEILHPMVHPEDICAYHTARERSARELAPWHIEYRVQLPRQGLCWRQGDARPQRQADGSTVWHGVFTDITERKRIEAELQEYASIDALTRLPNRRIFMSRIAIELARIQRGDIQSSSVLMCDLDHFKSINDKWGHAVGDQALQHFARILGAQLRKSDLVGRIGGEEFAVVLSSTDLIQAREFAVRLQQSLDDDVLRISGHEIPMSLSIGLALLTCHDHTPEIALSRSDSALYRAKKNGRNRIEVG